MEAIRLERVCKNYGGLHVLRNLTLSVEAGEHVAVIGPNGAGKTTLMNVITGALKCDSGKVYLFGRDITRLPTHRRTHLGMGRSFQISHLCSDLTILENTLLSLHGVGLSRFQMLRPSIGYRNLVLKARELLDSVDLWRKRETLVRTISYGEQRKLEIVLSLATEPRMLLLDEPTAGLSTDEVPLFIDMIKELAAGTSILLSSHDMDVVFGLGKRVIVLYYGEIMAEGAPKEIATNPKVREIYFGM